MFNTNIKCDCYSMMCMVKIIDFVTELGRLPIMHQ